MCVFYEINGFAHLDNNYEKINQLRNIENIIGCLAPALCLIIDQTRPSTYRALLRAMPAGGPKITSHLCSRKNS